MLNILFILVMALINAVLAINNVSAFLVDDVSSSAIWIALFQAFSCGFCLALAFVRLTEINLPEQK